MRRTLHRTSLAAVARIGGVIAILLVHAACASAPATPAPAPAPVGELDLPGAADAVAKDLATQIGAGASGRQLIIDPVRERVTGQRTGLTAEFERALAPAVTSSIKGIQLLAFNADGTTKARYVLTTTLAPTDSADRYAVSASLTDRPSGLVVAQSVARFRKNNADRTPSKFYDDSPGILRDRSVEGYVRTSETARGKLADPLYVSQLPTSALLVEAQAAYDAQRWAESLAAFEAVSKREDGQQLETFSGLYLSNKELNRPKAAEDAFAKYVALGIATSNLSMKLLFRPGSSSEFWPGRDNAGQYPMWLRQIARAAVTAKSCLNVVGHTSKSGTEAVNDRLSLARATTIRRLLVAESSSLAPQLRASGVGFRETLVGTGADNASDALDRRVEFKIEECKP